MLLLRCRSGKQQPVAYVANVADSPESDSQMSVELGTRSKPLNPPVTVLCGSPRKATQPDIPGAPRPLAAG
jgi:hypothetical protein